MPARFAALVAQPAQPKLERRTFETPDGTIARYGLAVPAGYEASSPRPLVVALHPGGEAGMVFHGDRYMRSIFLPGLRELDPIMIAPDAPGGSWTEPKAEQTGAVSLWFSGRSALCHRDRSHTGASVKLGPGGKGP